MARRIRRRVKPAVRRAPRRKTGARVAVSNYKKKVFNYSVKKAMKSLLEVKNSGIRGGFDILPFNGGNMAAVDSTNIIAFDPIINQGTGESGRVGNVITMVSCKMRYLITLNPSIGGASTIPTIVRMIWFYDREDTNNLPSPYSNANFIDAGNTSQQFSGSLTDLFYRYNTDRYRIFGVRDHKLGFANNEVNAAAGSQVALSQYFQNNDSKMFFKGSIDCSKWIIKRQKFNDNLGLSMTRKLYCLVLVVSQTGIGLLASAPQNKINYEIDFKYTDA